MVMELSPLWHCNPSWTLLSITQIFRASFLTFSTFGPISINIFTMESIFRIHQASKTLSFSLSMPFSHKSVNPQNLSQAGRNQCSYQLSKEPIFIPVQLFSQCPCSPLKLTNIMALRSRAQGIQVGETGRKVCRVAIFTNDPIFISHDDFR